jgi:hypothetical protein
VPEMPYHSSSAREGKRPQFCECNWGAECLLRQDIGLDEQIYINCQAEWKPRICESDFGDRVFKTDPSILVGLSRM